MTSSSSSEERAGPFATSDSSNSLFSSSSTFVPSGSASPFKFSSSLQQASLSSSYQPSNPSFDELSRSFGPSQVMSLTGDQLDLNSHGDFGTLDLSGFNFDTFGGFGMANGFTPTTNDSSMPSVSRSMSSTGSTGGVASGAASSMDHTSSATMAAMAAAAAAAAQGHPLGYTYASPRSNEDSPAMGFTPDLLPSFGFGGGAGGGAGHNGLNVVTDPNVLFSQAQAGNGPASAPSSFHHNHFLLSSAPSDSTTMNNQYGFGASSLGSATDLQQQYEHYPSLFSSPLSSFPFGNARNSPNESGNMSGGGAQGPVVSIGGYPPIPAADFSSSSTTAHGGGASGSASAGTWSSGPSSLSNQSSATNLSMTPYASSGSSSSSSVSANPHSIPPPPPAPAPGAGGVDAMDVTGESGNGGSGGDGGGASGKGRKSTGTSAGSPAGAGTGTSGSGAGSKVTTPSISGKRLNWGEMICQTIAHAPDGRLVIQELFERMVATFPEIREWASNKDWEARVKNRIKSTLSIKGNLFVKVPRTSTAAGKGSWWTLTPEEAEKWTPGRLANVVKRVGPGSSGGAPGGGVSGNGGGGCVGSSNSSSNGHGHAAGYPMGFPLGSPPTGPFYNSPYLHGYGGPGGSAASSMPGSRSGSISAPGSVTHSRTNSISLGGLNEAYQYQQQQMSSHQAAAHMVGVGHGPSYSHGLGSHPYLPQNAWGGGGGGGGAGSRRGSASAASGLGSAVASAGNTGASGAGGMDVSAGTTETGPDGPNLRSRRASGPAVSLGGDVGSGGGGGGGGIHHSLSMTNLSSLGGGGLPGRGGMFALSMSTSPADHNNNVFTAATGCRAGAEFGQFPFSLASKGTSASSSPSMSAMGGGTSKGMPTVGSGGGSLLWNTMAGRPGMAGRNSMGPPQSMSTSSSSQGVVGGTSVSGSATPTTTAPSANVGALAHALLCSASPQFVPTALGGADQRPQAQSAQAEAGAASRLSVAQEMMRRASQASISGATG
ncbi:hypothetical protein A4X09_0g2733 [Tilletia walkeri]|uniref:Fork-head domain-containing protein n=1 Tax=Tilletia walkeri TaxID=117179 RepID=A0A8X7T6R9_9BASI|nr:hypothetical protein A4X09_0g2733 [Tilletia walkeri]